MMRQSVPTRRMIRQAWKEKQRLRRGDHLTIIDDAVYLNGVALQNVRSLRIETQHDFDLHNRPYNPRFTEVYIELIVERGSVTRGTALI